MDPFVSLKRRVFSTFNDTSLQEELYAQEQEFVCEISKTIDQITNITNLLQKTAAKHNYELRMFRSNRKKNEKLKKIDRNQ